MLVSYLTYVDIKECSILQIKSVLLNTVSADLDVILLLKKKLQVTNLLVILNRLSEVMASDNISVILSVLFFSLFFPVDRRQLHKLWHTV